MEISRICISKVLCVVWSASYWDRIIDGKRTPSRTRRNSRWYIHWYNDTSIVLIYTCLKEAHKVSNSVLLFSWAEERTSSSSMFKYWMLIMKFQISYLVFIRSMREHNFKPFVKILIFMVKWFSISISIITIMLDGYPCIFKICWIFLSHALNSIKNFERGNFVIQISGRQFSLIHYTNSLWRPNRFPESC